MAFIQAIAPRPDLELNARLIKVQDLKVGDVFYGYFKHLFVEDTGYGKQACYVFSMAEKNDKNIFKLALDENNKTLDFWFYGNACFNNAFLENGINIKTTKNLEVERYASIFNKERGVKYGILTEIIYRGTKISAQYNKEMHIFSIGFDKELVNQRINTGNDVKVRRLELMGASRDEIEETIEVSPIKSLKAANEKIPKKVAVLEPELEANIEEEDSEEYVQVKGRYRR